MSETKAQRDLRMGAEYPYDSPFRSSSFSGLNGDSAVKLPAIDWAHEAARGILYDLNDRAGIKDGFAKVDYENRHEMVHALAAIIREAHSRNFGG